MTEAWARIRAEVVGPAPAPRNITAWTLTRHAQEGAEDAVALHWRPRSGATRAYTYRDLDRAASRFASGLGREGLRKGDRVAILAGRIPEVFVALLGSLRAGAVPTVLFSSYGPEPVRRRLERARARVLVTTPRLYAERVEPARAELGSLGSVLVVGTPGSLAPGQDPPPEGTRDLGVWLEAGDPSCGDVGVEAESPALLHFTSGTSGEPKGAVHAHDAVVAHAHTGRRVLGLGPGTRYWCTADPGWVTGVSYGILAPLALGSRVFVDEEEYDTARWWENLAAERIEVLYTSPTALRLLRRLDAALTERPLLPDLRAVFSVGEPLAPAEVRWAQETLGVPVRDTWWQTETGCIVVASPRDEAPRPGLLGRPVDGFDVACVRREGAHLVRLLAGETGELAIRAGWPSMFRAYLDDPDRYASRFADGWYLSGDLATMNRDGWLAFEGRTGDVFKSAGHLVSPGEVEAVLLDHPAVADAAVRAAEDPVVGAVVEAHVVLSGSRADSAELRTDILREARRRLGPALAPRALHVHDRLPRTESGKIVRRQL